METKTERKYVCYDRRFLSTGLDIANMILLTEIENLSKLPNGCYATDEQLGLLILISAKNTNERIKYLEKCGYIKCNTTFINKKRRRSISFTYVEGNPSREGITKRSHKKKVNPSRDGLPYPPGDGYNKLYKEVNTNVPKIEKEKETSENEARTERENTGPNTPVDTRIDVPPTEPLFDNNKNNNKNEEPKMKENEIIPTENELLASTRPDTRAEFDDLDKTIPTEEENSGMIILDNTRHDTRAEFEDLIKPTPTIEEPRSGVLTIEAQMKEFDKDTPTTEEPNTRAKIPGPDEILKKIESRVQQKKDVIDEMRNLDMFSKATKEELRKLGNNKCLEYILDYDYSEFEARILQPKFERIKVINDELKKLKFEYAHYGENGEIRITEEERKMFKNSKTFARFLSVNSNDEIFYMFLDEHPDYVDETNIFYEWMLDRFIEERKIKYNTQVPANI